MMIIKDLLYTHAQLYIDWFQDTHSYRITSQNHFSHLGNSFLAGVAILKLQGMLCTVALRANNRPSGCCLPSLRYRRGTINLQVQLSRTYHITCFVLVSIKIGISFSSVF